MPVKTPCGFSPSFLTPTFPFHSYMLLHEVEESRCWVPSVNFERLLCYFEIGAAPSLLSLSLLCSLLCLQIGRLSSPCLPWAGNLGRVPGVCSFSKVLLLVTCFLLNTTCNCIFVWNSTMLPAWECMQMTGQEMSHLEGRGFLEVFFTFMFLVFFQSVFTD